MPGRYVWAFGPHAPQRAHRSLDGAFFGDLPEKLLERLGARGLAGSGPVVVVGGGAVGVVFLRAFGHPKKGRT